MKIGELWISLGLSTASFSTNLNKAKTLAFGSSKEMARSFQLIGRAVLGMSTAAATGLAFLVNKQIDAADQMGKLSERFGIAVETLSGLAHATEMEGVEVENLAKGLHHLAQFMVANGEGSKDLKEKFFELAEQFSKSRDGAGKLAFAQRALGQTGAMLIPVLNKDRAGLEAAWQEADQLGKIFDTKTTVAAREFNKNLGQLRGMMTGFANDVMREVLPALRDLSGEMVRSGESTESFGTILGGLGTRSVGQLGGDIQLLSLVVSASGVQFEIWGTQIELAFLALSRGFRGVGPRGEKLRNELAGLKAEMEELGRAMLRIGKPVIDFTPIPSHGPARGGGLQMIDEQAAAAAKKHAEAIQGIIGKLREQIVELQLSPAAFAAYKAGLEGASGAQQQLILDLWKTLEALKAAQGAFIGPQSPLQFLNENLTNAAISTREFDKAFEEQKARMAEGRQVWESVLNPIERYSLELQKLTVLLDVGAISQDIFRKASDQIAQSLGLVADASKNVNPQLEEMRATMRGFAEQSLLAFEQWIVGGGSFRGVLQGILQDLARMILQLTVIQPLMRGILGAGGGGGGGGGLFGWLSGLFGGGAGGINIGASNFPSFGNSASGGSFQHGGTAPLGMFSIVGERGPEPIFPTSHGTIVVPHKELARVAGGAGVTNVFHIDARGADLGTQVKIAAMLDRFALKHFAEFMQDRQSRTA